MVTRDPGSTGRRQGRDLQAATLDTGKPLTAKLLAAEDAAAALTMQFLGLVGAGRTYGETMEAWRTTCPRMPIWEDAIRDGLVRIESGGAMNSSRIVLTGRGRARLGRLKA